MDWVTPMLKAAIVAHRPASILVTEWMAKEILYVYGPVSELPKRPTPPLPQTTSWQKVLLNFDGVWLIEDRAMAPHSLIVMQGFMGAYAEIPKEQPLKPHEVRVIEERDELNGKITKLEVFMDSAGFRMTNASERLRLCNQLDIMKQYHAILTERIGAFTKGDKP